MAFGPDLCAGLFSVTEMMTATGIVFARKKISEVMTRRGSVPAPSTRCRE